jgi:predicted glutamine amidotransferase
MRREASIGRQERHMRFAHNGRLTHFDRVRLNHRLNRTSHAIYRARHAGRRARLAGARKQ